MMGRRFRQGVRLLAVLAFGLTATSVLRSVDTAAQSVAGQDAVVDVPGAGYPPALKAVLDSRQPPALKRFYARDNIPNSVTLAPVTDGPKLVVAARVDGPLQVGFSRDVPASGAASLSPAAVVWAAVDGGSVTAVSVTSPGAVALRLAVAFGSLPAGLEVRFFGPGADSQVFGPVTPEQIQALTLPAETGGPGVYWSPVIPGDTAGMEIFVPTGLERSLSFTIPRVSHQYQSVEPVEPIDKAAGTCNIDVACFSASWGTTARATAKISYISGGGSFVCTGTLLNDTDSSTFIPYFMTANHCISTQAEASTINSFWNYQRTTCGGALGPFTTLTGGATLLSHGSGSDHSFLRLNDPAPSSAVFAGWNSGTVSPGTSMVGIHHPDGDVKKISFGVVDGLADFGSSVSGSGGYLRVHWTSGVVEPGSSGSGLITGSSPNEHRFVGTLRGGQSACSTPTGGDWYGRFDLVYPLVREYLDPTRVIVLSGDLAFGSIPVGYPATRTLTIRNTGNATLTVVGISYPDGFSGNWSDGMIPPGGSQQVLVAFAPGTQATYSGNITVDGNQTSGNNKISASGQGVLGTVPGPGDIDGDGFADFVWRNGSTGRNVIWCLKGTMRACQIDLPAQPDAAWRLVASADVNKDGRGDVVWRNTMTGENVVWYLNGGTFLGQASFPSVADPTWQIVASADINRDGRPDLVWRNVSNGASVVWYLNGTTLLGQASFPTGTDLGWQLEAAADMNRDGAPDLLWRNTRTGDNVVWYLNGTNISSQVPLPSLPDLTWRLVTALDINRDGWPDLIWRNADSGENQVWFMSNASHLGVGRFDTVTDQSWQLLGATLPEVAADVNVDRHPDLIWRNKATGDNVVWYLNGTTIIGQANLPAVPDVLWQLVAKADVNRDMRPDLIWRNKATGDNVVWYLNGTTLLGQANLLPSVPDGNWRIVGAADINGDTRPDLVWRNVATGANVVWYLNGVTLLSQASLPTEGNLSWQVGAVADINGDAHPDLVWRNTVSGENVVWYLNGTTRLGIGILPTVTDSNWQIAGAADVRDVVGGGVSGDGHPDLIWRNTSNGANVVWYLNGTTLLRQASLPTVPDKNWILRPDS